MKWKAAVFIVAVLSLTFGGFVFAQDNSTTTYNGQYWKGQQTENQQFRSDLKNSNDTNAQKHEAIVQHRIQQHKENMVHHSQSNPREEWERKMAERRAEREKRIAERRAAHAKHMADLRAEREKRIAERKAQFHQHHTTSGGQTSSAQPQVQPQ